MFGLGSTVLRDLRRLPSKIGMIEERDQFAIWRDRGICDVARVCGKDGKSAIRTSMGLDRHP